MIREIKNNKNVQICNKDETVDKTVDNVDNICDKR
jgi:hypothetical protein